MTTSVIPRQSMGMVTAGRRWFSGPLPWLAYLPFYAVPWLWRAPTSAEAIASAAGVAVFLPAYLFSWRLGGARLIAAIALVVAVGVSLAPFGGSWTVFSIYASAMAGSLRPARRAVVVVAAVALVTVLAALWFRQPLVFWLPSLMLVVLTGGATISREAFFDRTTALLATQEEVRRLAGMAERERMARDLHDVVGRTLTLVALKADLAAKYAGRDTSAAEAEMRSVAQIAREGLNEVRSALAGEAGGGLAHEAAAAKAALTDCGVDSELSGDLSSVPRDPAAILAMTLREAITNVIRHAGATKCGIRVSVSEGQARLEVVDDGRSPSFREGNGLTGMRQRLVAAGGSLSVVSGLPGTRLMASVPA